MIMKMTDDNCMPLCHVAFMCVSALHNVVLVSEEEHHVVLVARVFPLKVLSLNFSVCFYQKFGNSSHISTIYHVYMIQRRQELSTQNNMN